MGGMNKTASIVIVIIAALAASWDHLPDLGIDLEIVREQPLILSEYGDSLAIDMVDVADGIDSGKSVAEVTDAIQAAFDRAKSNSYLAIAGDIEALDNEDRAGLEKLLREVAKGLE